MPAYIVHGFRWHRPAIRIHIILQDLEDAAAEWIIAPDSATCFVESFYKLYDFLPPLPPVPRSSIPSPNGTTHLNAPERSKSTSTRKSSRTERSTASSLSGHEPTKEGQFLREFNARSPVKLLEQFDPDDLSVVSQPYAYIADYIVDVRLSADIAGEMEAYEKRVHDEAESARRRLNGREAATSVDKMITGDSKIEADNMPVIDEKPPEGNDHKAPTTNPDDHWLGKLKDALQKDEKVGWYIVHCGDEDRDDEGMDAFSIPEEEEQEVVEQEEIVQKSKRQPVQPLWHTIPTSSFAPKKLQKMQVLPTLPRPVTASSNVPRPSTANTTHRPKTPNMRAVKAFFGRKDDPCDGHTNGHVPDMSRLQPPKAFEDRPATASRGGSVRSDSTQNGTAKYANARNFSDATITTANEGTKTPKLRTMRSFFGRKERHKEMGKA